MSGAWDDDEGRRRVMVEEQLARRDLKRAQRRESGG